MQNIAALAHRGDWSAVLAAAQTALARQPAFELHVHAANAAVQLGQHAEAIGQLQAALALRPEFGPARRQLSQLLNHQAAESPDQIQVIPLYQRALALWDGNAAARFNLARLLLETEPRTTLALLAPLPADDPEVRWLCLQAAAREGDPTPFAGAAWADDTLAPPESRRQLLQQLAWNGAPGVARAPGAALVAADPRALLADLTAALALPATVEDIQQLADARQGWAQGLQRITLHWTPERLRARGATLDDLTWCNFLLAYQGQDDRSLQSAYGDWLHGAASSLLPTYAQPPDTPRRPGPLRIGLLSSFWRQCTVGAYFGAWTEALVGPDTDTVLLSLGTVHDAWTTRLETQCARAERLQGPLARIARSVAALDLDLLVYPELGMDGRTLALAALRLARRQVCGWGHPVTSGLPTLDAYLSCAQMEPPGAVAHYREPRLLLLPDLGTRYALPARPPVTTRAALGLPEQRELVALPCSAFKLHPETDAVLADFLALRPRSTLVLLRTEAPGAMARLETRLQQALRSAGADPLRQLLWLPALDRSAFLAMLSACDLVWDPLHWSGGNTALDALWMGTPILTTRGAFMRGRQSAAMLEALGVSAVCVAARPADLPRQAAILLDEPELRARWRRELPLRLADWISQSRALTRLRQLLLD